MRGQVRVKSVRTEASARREKHRSVVSVGRRNGVETPQGGVGWWETQDAATTHFVERGAHYPVFVASFVMFHTIVGAEGGGHGLGRGGWEGAGRVAEGAWSEGRRVGSRACYQTPSYLDPQTGRTNGRSEISVTNMREMDCKCEEQDLKCFSSVGLMATGAPVPATPDSSRERAD